MKKIVLFILISFLSINIYAQENIVSQITTGTDNNNDKAVNKALRNAVEQAFGSFLVSKSTLVNDQLASDEILTVSSGNIVSYEVVSTITNPDNKEVTATVSSKVSLVKLKSFIESKGVEVDFKGKLFAQNIMMQEFYEQSEIKALKELKALMKEFNDKSFDYKVEAREPQKNNEKWIIPLVVSTYMNDNFYNLKNNFITTLKNISLSQQQANEYEKLGKNIFRVVIVDKPKGALNTFLNEPSSKLFFLRKKESLQTVLDIILNFKTQISSFEIDNGLDKISLPNYYHVSQNNFQPIILNLNPSGGYLSRNRVAASYFGLFDESMHINEGREGFGSKSDQAKIYLSRFCNEISLSNNCSFTPDIISNIAKYGYGENAEISNYYLGNDKNLFDLFMSVNQLRQPSYDLVLNFKDLCDRNKLSTQLIIFDFKTLEDIQKIDKYRIYPKPFTILYGIGVQLKNEDGKLLVESLQSGSPAWKSNKVHPGEEIIKVAEGNLEPINITGYAATDAVKLIRGTEEHSEVRLTLKQADGSIKVVSLFREKIK